MNRFRTIFSVLLCCLINRSGAQITQPYRFEKEWRSNQEDYMIIPRAEKGLVLVRQTNTFRSGDRRWEILFLDTALTEKKLHHIDVDQRKNLLGYEVSHSSVYLLFGQFENQVKSTFLLYELTEDSERGYEINTELNFVISQFTCISKNILLGGFVNNEPAVLLFRTENESIKLLPGFFQKDTDLLDLRTNENNTFSVLLMDRRSRNDRKLILRIFDSEGVELFQREIAMGERKAPQTCMVSTLAVDDMLIAGTWGAPHSRLSMGFFAVPVDPGQVHQPNLYAFGDLSQYLSHLKENKRKRVQSKTAALMKSGRLPDYLEHVRPMRLQESKEGFVLLAEVFQPSTNVRDPMFYPVPFYGWPYPVGHPYYPPIYYPMVYNRWYNPYFPPPTSRDTEQIKVMRSVVIAFDSRAKLVWDHVFDLDDLRISSPEQMSDFCISNQSLYIVFKKRSELHIKKINLQNQEGTVQVIPVALREPSDEIVLEKDRNAFVRYWYGNMFYVWGVQNLRNRENRDNPNRQVFYINAVRVD